MVRYRRLWFVGFDYDLFYDVGRYDHALYGRWYIYIYKEQTICRTTAIFFHNYKNIHASISPLDGYFLLYATCF